MKKMLKAAAVLAAMVMALTLGACSDDDGGGSGGGGSKLPNGTIKAVYYDVANYGINVVAFYADGTFVKAYTEDNYSFYNNDSITDLEFEIGNQGTYTGDPTKDTGNDNKVLLTFTKISNGGLYNVSPEEYSKEYPEFPLEGFKNREATITGGGEQFTCGNDVFAFWKYSRKEGY